MTLSRIVPIVLSMAVLVIVAVVQERSRYLAAIIATMPVSVPLALWVVYAANRNQTERVVAFTFSMLAGLLATAAFVLASWAALRLRLPLLGVIAVGYAAWGMVALGLRLLFPAAG
jgi:hypothetical protein